MVVTAQILTKLENYQPSEAAAQLIRTSPILFLVGFTGAGKDAVKHLLLTTGDYHHVVSHTTRSPRVNHGVLEQDGVEYHFIDVDEAARMLDAREFIEAKVYSDNLYGTSISEIQLANSHHKVAITDIEVQGIAEYKAIAPEVKAVFLLPPSYEIWQERLIKRYGNNVEPADYLRRMTTAISELDELFSTDYYVPIINDDLEEAAAKVHRFIKDGLYDPAERNQAQAVARQIYARIKSALQELPTNSVT